MVGLYWVWKINRILELAVEITTKARPEQN